MPRLVQIRDVPDGGHETLLSRAAEAGVSLPEYLLRALLQLAERPPRAEVLTRAPVIVADVWVPSLLRRAVLTGELSSSRARTSAGIAG